ncbi:MULTISPECIES: SDR family NAD(P)-dependent oxidoreductase [unclassified Mycolicibacterium]|uniref:SDR family oxidoreductase n=1 Tax=unclassified Mycolicibacterium TaxID=2636767 RepID=UPI001F4C2600|nr:SDR family NAD(P)-dependent oxidoreductase [Mycolicibacterium sp. YH-1]UNB50264.1 SDR family oxidoreductase [Mycolicibacterium sp. YH-1]
MNAAVATSENDRVYVVTGAGSGIGRATVQLLHSEGRRVVLADTDYASIKALAADLNDSRGASACAVEHDVTRADSWSALCQQVAEFGTIYGLVNNAGITRDKSMLSMAEDQFSAVIDVHLRGSWLGCKSVVPAMRTGGGGSIVNISSSNRHGAFGQTNYSAAKAGVVGLTNAVAVEQAKYGIRCNAVAPGAINTPMIGDVPEHVKARWMESIALGRLGEPSEIASAITFLLSDAASYVTAALLDVTGGEQHL